MACPPALKRKEKKMTFESLLKEESEAQAIFDEIRIRYADIRLREMKGEEVSKKEKDKVRLVSTCLVRKGYRDDKDNFT